MSIAEKLTAVAENQQKVYDAGKKSEYDAFWDMFQKNGTRTSYTYGFAGTGWDDTIFRPKYDLIFVGNQEQAFRHFPVKDLIGCLEATGVQFDLSGATSLFYMFATSKVLELPVLDCRSVTNFGGAFGWSSNLHTIQKIILKDDGSQSFSSTFDNDTNLENLTFEGVIGTNGLNLSSCTKLTHDSLMSVINCLKDYADSGTTYTVTFGAANLAKLTADEKKLATEKGWTLA